MLFCKNVIYWGSPEVRKLECWNIGMLEGWKVQTPRCTGHLLRAGIGVLTMYPH